MAEASVPFDPLNPGHVLACIGLAEAAEVLLGGARGVFDWSEPASPCFRVAAEGRLSPVQAVLEFLDGATTVALAPAAKANDLPWKKDWCQLEVFEGESSTIPGPDKDKVATFACVLRNGPRELLIDYWGDGTERDSFKLWAGAGGYPGAQLAEDALALVRGRAASAVDDPFALALPQSSSFRLDWRRDYIPLDIGFSLNEHEDISSIGFPLVELLAALGLRYARPRRVGDRREKLKYAYAIAGRATPSELWLPLSFLRAAVGAAELPFPMRRFRIQLGWPGKEGHARSITSITEEQNP